MRLVWASVLCAALSPVAAGCTVTSGSSDAGPLPFDTPRPDAGRDAPPIACTSVADCDDRIPCTTDACVFGGVCEHTPLDALCATDQRCDPTRGCVTGATECVTQADCMVGRTYCDGTWTCIASVCYLDTPRDCDDGNDCTVDTCDDTAGGGAGGCTYATASGCDGGVVLGDGGVPACDPFDPTTGYTGEFLILPTPSSGCGISAPSYRAQSATFSVSGGQLRVLVAPGLEGTPFTLTGAVPTDASFSVSYDDGCFRGSLMGSFTCDDRFTGTFRGSYTGGCVACSGGAPFSVQGIAR